MVSRRINLPYIAWIGPSGSHSAPCCPTPESSPTGRTWRSAWASNTLRSNLPLGRSARCFAAAGRSATGIRGKRVSSASSLAVTTFFSSSTESWRILANEKKGRMKLRRRNSDASVWGKGRAEKLQKKR